MPKRIQRKRTKGWRMPEGAVYVGRPSIWGNPFKPDGATEYLLCDASHRRTIFTPWVIFDHDQDTDHNFATSQMAVDYYRRWLNHEFDEANVVRPCRVTPADLERLRGKDLACFCPLDQPCHADILLELANAEQPACTETEGTG